MHAHTEHALHLGRGKRDQDFDKMAWGGCALVEPNLMKSITIGNYFTGFLYTVVRLMCVCFISKVLLQSNRFNIHIRPLLALASITTEQPDSPTPQKIKTLPGLTVAL